jgi:hypothetical protein
MAPPQIDLRGSFLHPRPPCESGRASGAGGAGGGAGGWHRVAPRWGLPHVDPFQLAGRLPPTPANFLHPQPTRKAGPRAAVVGGWRRWRRDPGGRHQ